MSTSDVRHDGMAKPLISILLAGGVATGTGYWLIGGDEEPAAPAARKEAASAPERSAPATVAAPAVAPATVEEAPAKPARVPAAPAKASPAPAAPPLPEAPAAPRAATPAAPVVVPAAPPTAPASTMSKAGGAPGPARPATAPEGGAPAAPEVPVPPPAGTVYSGSWRGWPAASGDWGGLRTRLEEAGLGIGLQVTSEISQVAHRGAVPDERLTTSRTLVDATALYAFDALTGWPGASLFVHGQWSDGDAASRATGDIQGWSNISTANDLRQVAEFWAQQTWGQRPGGAAGEPLLRLRAGKVDANTEYDSLPAAGAFINSSAGFSPTIYGFATFPDPAMGVHLAVAPTSRWSATAGYMDGSGTAGRHTGVTGIDPLFERRANTGKLMLGQVRYAWPRSPIGEAGLVQVGAWHHSGTVTRLDGGEQQGTSGMFAQAQVDLWHGGDDRTVTLFAQWGNADRQVSEVDTHRAGGLYWTGLPWRAADGAGLYVSNVSLASAPGPGAHERSETAVEAVYALQATAWCVLKADVQYIFHPGGADDPGHAAVADLRAIVTF